MPPALDREIVGLDRPVGATRDTQPLRDDGAFDDAAFIHEDGGAADFTIDPAADLQRTFRFDVAGDPDAFTDRGDVVGRPAVTSRLARLAPIFHPPVFDSVQPIREHL